MSDQKKPDDSKRPSSGRPGDEDPRKMPYRQGVVWIIIMMALLFMLWMHQGGKFSQLEEMDYYPKFIGLLEPGNKVGKVTDITVYNMVTGVRRLEGSYVPANGKAKPFKVYVTDDVKILDTLKDHNIRVKVVDENPMMMQLIVQVVIILLIVAAIYFLFVRQIRSAGQGALNFGKSRARLLEHDRNKVTFADVAGVDEAKEEVHEIIEFLRDPRRFQKLGGRIPKGVLLVGPPGTGKTLLAKAIAGEADVPFFSISGSDFVEMFVGVGASRVRDMFEQGKKNAPCLIFIDEIDAVGRSRFSGIGGGHDEREQTLNALLVEMDGFDTQEGVIIIAATNRPDVLDQALLRPGRFDRQIVVDLPTVDGREAILHMHARKIKLAGDVDLRFIARGTPGFSGADLSNLLNEAALHAARTSKEAVDMEDLEEARDKVRWGRERKSYVLDDKEKKITAYHEAGHALMMLKTEQSEPLHKITIIPRGQAYLGATMQLPEKDTHMEGKVKLKSMLADLMGGRVAEELIFGDVTSGAAGDIQHATRIARAMVCDWGMSPLGLQKFSEASPEVQFGRGTYHHPSHSNETARRIDEEVKFLIDEAYEAAKKTLSENLDGLHLIAKYLLENETMDGVDARELLEFGRVRSREERRNDEGESNDGGSADASTARKAEKPSGSESGRSSDLSNSLPPGGPHEGLAPNA